jgi:hypothetical protein
MSACAIKHDLAASRLITAQPSHISSISAASALLVRLQTLAIVHMVRIHAPLPSRCCSPPWGAGAACPWRCSCCTYQSLCTRYSAAQCPARFPHGRSCRWRRRRGPRGCASGTAPSCCCAWRDAGSQTASSRQQQTKRSQRVGQEQQQWYVGVG